MMRPKSLSHYVSISTTEKDMFSYNIGYALKSAPSAESRWLLRSKANDLSCFGLQIWVEYCRSDNEHIREKIYFKHGRSLVGVR